MGNHLKGCRCSLRCRQALHTKVGGFFARLAVRRLRHQTRIALHTGEEPPRTTSIPCLV